MSEYTCSNLKLIPLFQLTPHVGQKKQQTTIIIKSFNNFILRGKKKEIKLGFHLTTNLMQLSASQHFDSKFYGALNLAAI